MKHDSEDVEQRQGTYSGRITKRPPSEYKALKKHF